MRESVTDVFSVDDCYNLLACNEHLRASYLWEAPEEGANSRPHLLRPEEKLLSKKLVRGLADAILRSGPPSLQPEPPAQAVAHSQREPAAQGALANAAAPSSPSFLFAGL